MTDKGTTGPSDSSAAAEQQDDHSQVYWFFKNSKDRIAGGLGKWAKAHKLLAVLLGLLFLFFVFVGRSFYQPAFLFVRKYFILGIALLIILLILRHFYKKYGKGGRAVVVLLFIALVAGVWFWGVGMVNYLALYYHYQRIEKVELKKLPQTGFERIQPWNSIKTLVRQEALSETESATDPHFIRRSETGTGERYDFSMAVGPSPEYLVQRLTRNMYQIISVPGTAMAPDFSSSNRIDVDFDIGEVLLFSRNSRNATIKRFNLWQLLSYQADEVRYMENDLGEWVEVVSLIHWKGLLFPRPVFGGVVVIPQKKGGIKGYLQRVTLGSGQWIKPQDIPSYSWLDGQNLIPDRASRFTAESFRFHDGFLAPLPGYHEGDIRIPDLPSDQNPQPFIIWLDFSSSSARAPSALYAYFGLEPYQRDKRGLNMSLFLPGDGQEIVYFMDHAARQDGYIGSSAVPSKVKESRKIIDWNTSHPAESRPFIRSINGQERFFWLSTVVTRTDSTGQGFIGGSIPDVTITDARNSQVVWIDKQQAGNQDSWLQQLKEELGPIWAGEMH